MVRESSERVCTRCVLPDTFPGISFDANGVCNFCTSGATAESRQEEKARFRARFDDLLKRVKGTGCYDAIMCYSGGKDSTYTLRVLKESFDLRVMAFTVDNGFVPEQTRRNIDAVVERLGVDHVCLKPRFDVLSGVFMYCSNHDVFPAKTLERASTICTACMSIVKFSALRLAIEKRIPLIAFGWSPGQAPITSSIMKNNPAMVTLTQKAALEPLGDLAGGAMRPYFLEAEHFSDASRFPYNVHPLAFMDYREDEIYASISSLGWEAPGDLDPNSTNCMLNSFANAAHRERFHFHPYAFELAGLVRQGHLDRETALKRLSEKEDPAVVERVRSRLQGKK